VPADRVIAAGWGFTPHAFRAKRSSLRCNIERKRGKRHDDSPPIACAVN